MKMAIVGCEASGKTVFMCALADYYGQDAAKNPLRLRLTPENAAANSFERYQFRQMRCLKRWPLATPPERTIEMKWSLRSEGKSLAEIDMLEFGGETYRAAFRSNAPGDAKDKSAEELLNYLSGADFFVVLVSIKALLTQKDIANEQDFERDTEALWVTRGILNFIQAKRPGAGIVIGLTQADRYRSEIGDYGGAQQLLTHHWPTVAAAAEGIPVVEVASVSKTDDEGNPAEGYHTHGILPVMQAFSKHCFGDANALENGSKRLILRSTLRRAIILGGLGLVTLCALMIGGFRLSHAIHAHENCSCCSQPPPKMIVVSLPVTNTVEVEKIVEKVVTNKVEKLVEKPITNTVEKIVRQVVEKPVTNTVEKIVRQVIEKPVTNTVEKIVEKVVTNVIEKVTEKPVAKTALHEKAVSSEQIAAKSPSPADVTPQGQVPPGYRVWTDYNGRKIIAKWLTSSSDGNNITILTKNNRRIDAILWKFSADDQNYIKTEIERHAKLGEQLSEGVWIRSSATKK